MPRSKRREFSFNEFTVLGAFVAVALFGIAFGAFVAVPGRFVAVTEPAPAAPTPEEYEASAREVLAPFFAQANLVAASGFPDDAAPMVSLVEKTQERLLRLRVPNAYRESHLSLVLLLDQWKRALRGSAADQAAAPGKTDELLNANPWLR